jgi:hypothetical protein
MKSKKYNHLKKLKKEGAMMAKTIQTRLNEFLRDTDYSARVVKSDNNTDLEQSIEVALQHKLLLHNRAEISENCYQDIEVKIWAKIHEWILREDKTTKHIYKRILGDVGDQLDKLGYRLIIERIRNTNLYKVYLAALTGGIASSFCAMNVETLCDIVIEWIIEEYAKTKGGDSNERILY